MQDLLEQSIKRTEARIAALITLHGKNNIDTKNETYILQKLLRYKEDRKFHDRIEMLKSKSDKG